MITENVKMETQSIVLMWTPLGPTVEPRNADTIGTYRKCPDKRGVLISGVEYSGTSDKGPSEKGTTSLQRTLLQVPLPLSFLTSEIRTEHRYSIYGQRLCP